MMSNMPHVLVALTALAGCLHDLRSRRIPNYLTFGSAAVAFVYALATAGWSGLAVGIAGWALGIALFIPFFLLRGMGAGDVKLLAALGAWIGPISLLSLTFYTAISGGVMALVVVLWRRKLIVTFENLWLLLCHFRVIGLKPMSDLSLENKNTLSLPYGLPIAAGTILTLWLH
jgi:prepilin peptidase CpaA